MKKQQSTITLLLLALLAFAALQLWTFNWQNLLPNLVGTWHAGKALFRTEGTSLEALLLPAVLWAAIILLIKELWPQPTTLARLLVVGGTLFFGVRYELWRVFFSLNLDDPINGTLSVGLFLAELLMVFNTLGFFFHCSFTINRSPEADRYEQDVVSGKYQPWVDVILPTYNEGVDILRRSVIACQAMDYPNKRIYLLDDTRRPHVRALAAELGCEYRDRPDNRHAKAGNINHALPTLSGEFIAVFDADFTPCRNFLNRTIGFFQDPKTAMVQTPQHFFNEDPITVNLGLEGIVNNEQSLFFRFIQPSRDWWDAVVCCGTCFVIRRSALDEIGGIPTDTITEDYMTSMKLQSLGYRVKYLNEALSAGMSPETISAYVNQRLRWGQGTLQMLFVGGNCFTVPNLRLSQRFSHALSIVYWFLALSRVICLLVPLTFLLFGAAPLRATINEILYFYLPYYIGNALSFAWFTEGRRSAFWSDVYETILAFPMAITIVRTIIQPRGKTFKVTPKGIIDPHRINPNWPLIRPLLAVAALTILGILWRSRPLQDTTVNPDSLTVNLFWSTYNLGLLLVSIMVAIDVPQRRFTRFNRDERCHFLRTSENCELTLGGSTYSGYTLDMSEGGARLHLWSEDLSSQEMAQCLKKAKGYLCFSAPSELAGLTLPVTIRWCAPLSQKPGQKKGGFVAVGVLFAELSLVQQRRLIPYLYCQPSQWEEVRAPELKTAWAMLQSLFRLHPLAESR
ncbi:glycosyltransferase [Thermosynechococcus sp. M55_K2018_012]|uniref:glycosyltransferase n=1 Tax=Thermosynechococcus sp. M55_K2018_012 TaxID=2747809 RepID=UPI0025EF3CB2|nr:glycosyltransferase [Thermosynechococcus sp. M55_K2018_012]